MTTVRTAHAAPRGIPTLARTRRGAGSATSLVHTRITHSRTSPIRHTFTYRSLSWLVDVDAPPQLPRGMRALATFRAGDHFPQPATPGESLRDRLERHLRASGIEPPTGQVQALLSPRVVGYVFNPLSVFWCHRPDGSLALVVAEVHNTYGDRHCYVVHPDDSGRAEVDKEFYVSPFNDVSGRYRLRVPEPADDGRVAVSVTLVRPGHDPFVATLTGRCTPATTRAVVAAQLRAPLAPLVVSARIRLHGIRLWARRLPLVARPDPPHVATRDDEAASHTARYENESTEGHR